MATGLNILAGPYVLGFQLEHQQLDAVVMPDLQGVANNAELLEQLRQRRFGPTAHRRPTPTMATKLPSFGPRQRETKPL
ncbi:hypothetical protein HRG_004308 [Hirsutella rhossiliensis]|uniref:Uncharacterized protein n=1 Tax=Hirsutella rhossiliensis TaxID=111463 RepID=A0A9P8MYZ7_9HYPO|nr:uncharacterized protein HRG_04308 [Hirsutella rhossiliensis]KAH0963880.1 hypothetical protein HRG_04308 [Hirsutella rhossiliensis]